jgi:hypothetical protein
MSQSVAAKSFELLRSHNDKHDGGNTGHPLLRDGRRDISMCDANSSSKLVRGTITVETTEAQRIPDFSNEGKKVATFDVVYHSYVFELSDVSFVPEISTEMLATSKVTESANSPQLVKIHFFASDIHLKNLCS